MPNYATLTRNIETINDYDIQHVVFEDGIGVVTVSDNRTGDWDGHHTTSERENTELVKRLKRLVAACGTVNVRRHPAFLIQRAIEMSVVV